jgi:hypothetical protein
MGVDVLLEDARRSVLEELPDPDGHLARLLPLEDARYPLLGWVDLYGDTVFNGGQAARLLEELRSLESSCAPEHLSVLHRLRDLAVKCNQQVHTFLRFQGD